MKRHTWFWATALVAIAGATTTAFAQPAPAAEAPTPQGGRLNEIVVTAERRATNLQDTPISITAFTSDSLENLGVNTVNDLAAIAPNLTATTGPQGSADANFFIRGVGQFDFIVTNDPGVGVYVDGVYLGRTVGAMLDSGDIGRVEVLRGPQGTLFGRNTLGGAISVTSKAPDPSAFSAEAKVTIGERERQDFEGGINIPLGGDNAARLFAFSRKQDGFATSFNGAKFGATDRQGVKGQVRVAPKSGITVDLAADYSLDQSNPAPSVLRAIAPLPFFPSAAAADIQNPNNFYRIFSSNSPESRNEIWGVSATVSADLGAATLKSITAYRTLDGFSTSDPDGTRFRLYDQATNTDQTQFSQELQLSGDLANTRLSYLVGAYAFIESAQQELRLCFAPLVNPVPPTVPFNACNTWNQGNDQDTKSYAVFGQARVNLTDALSVTLGGRYTSEEKDIISNQSFDFRGAGVGPGAVSPPPFGFGLPLTPGAFVVFPIVSNLRSSADFTKFTPKVGLEYKVSDDVLLFASYAQGFRSGGFNGRLIAPQATVPSYEPDTNDSIEAGVKSDLLDGAVRLNATVFRSKYKGIQQTISDPAVQFRVANAGDAELYGAEVELTAAPTEALLLTANIGYTSSEFQDVPASVGPINGNRLPFSPEWTASLGASYDFPLGDLGSLTPRVDYRYQSKTFFTAFNLPFEQQDGYGLLSARLTWRSANERVNIALYGDNLTDEEYYTFGQNALAAQGVAYTYLGRPSEWGLTAGVKF